MLVTVVVLINTCSLMLSCVVSSRVCLCLVFLCVRGRPPLWRGFVTGCSPEKLSLGAGVITLLRRCYENMLKTLPTSKDHSTEIEPALRFLSNFAY